MGEGDPVLDALYEELNATGRKNRTDRRKRRQLEREIRKIRAGRLGGIRGLFRGLFDDLGQGLLRQHISKSQLDQFADETQANIGAEAAGEEIPFETPAQDVLGFGRISVPSAAAEVVPEVVPEIEEIEVTAEKRPEIEPEVVATPKKKRKTETKAEGKARRAREKAERKAKEKEIIGNVGSLLERVVPAVLSSIDQTRIEKLEKAIAKEQYGPVGSLIKKHTGTAYRKLSMEERKLAAEDIIKAILKGE